MPKMTNWFVTAAPASPYAAPEVQDRRMCLAGSIDSHPTLDITPAKREVITSPVVRVEGRKVYTHSGTCYELVGAPHENFALFLNGREFNEIDPLGFAVGLYF